jgi:RHS repeat-associated protein
MSDGGWTRNVQDVAGNLAAIVSATSDELQLANLHGDVVATAPNVSNAAGIDAYFESTEFGAPRTSNSTSSRYAWLGGKRRDSGDALAGIVLMGVRLYSPALGRFLQVDPVPVGSANSYDYAYQDPVNKTDLDGTCSWGWLCNVAHVVNSGLHNPLVRTLVIVGIVALACAGTVGLGCGLAVGIGVGVAVSVADYQINSRHHDAAGYARAAGWGAFDGALAGFGGGYARESWRAGGLLNRARFGFHTKHLHNIAPLGRVPHFQLNLWRKGGKAGSGTHLYIPWFR